jgi:uncharacterized protein (TIGR02246 family)
MIALSLLAILGSILAGASQQAAQQPQPNPDADTAAVQALYRQWSEALATRGAEGYVSFFAADGAVLPPDGPAIEGRDAIRQWIQKVLDESTTKDVRLIPGPMQVANGWATWRFTLSGRRVFKKGGAPVPFNNKYLDVLRKQQDGSWKFVYRMWNSNDK